jgi:hypothetical protein
LLYVAWKVSRTPRSKKNLNLLKKSNYNILRPE